jgi:dTDP-4-dehydrorhamnose 3,5-epimerase
VIDGVHVKTLNVIPDERGWLMEMLRSDDEIFQGFGQVYLTAAYPGVVKGWHYHKNQVDHFVCVRGVMKVALYDPREDSPTRGQVNEFFIGDHNQRLIQIPPLVYHGFKCVSHEPALLVNTVTRPYDHQDPDEFRVHPHDNDIPYDWSRVDG